MLGSLAESDPRQVAEHTWRALTPHLTRSPYMRLRRYSRTQRRHIYPQDRRLTTELPDRPAALRLYNGGVAWVLGLDFDPKGHQHDAATVAAHAADAAQFFRQLGGRPISDVAASGGRHVWIPLAVPITLDQARHLAHACRRLWPTLDISSTVNPNEGCLTAPGSRCKDGGFRQLTTPLPEAYQAVTTRSAADLVTRALARLTDLVPDDQPTTTACVLQLGGRPRPLSPLHTQIAEHGVWPATHTTHDGRPWTRSEACYAVLCAAATRGHSYADVLHHIDTGRWSGLLTLYTGRYGPRWRRRLDAEWRKAQQAASASTQAPQATHNTGGGGGAVTDGDFVRRWLAVALAVLDQLIASKQRHNARALLWSLAWLGWRTGRRHVEAGTRSYSRACAGIIDHTTAAAILRELRDLPAEQAVVKRVSTGRGTHGDLYELIIPTAYRHLAVDPATWPDPRPIPGVFGVRDSARRSRPLLGATGWRIHQALAAGASGTAAQIAVAAGVSRSETYNMLPKLVRLGLARNLPGTASSAAQWGEGEATTREAGQDVDATAYLARLDARHRRERRLWREALERFAARRQAATPSPDEPIWWPPDWDIAPPPGLAPDPDAQAEETALAVLATTFDITLVKRSNV
ncbi:helix-turn-helix domain-containing protein [Micromonospora sp. NPDC006766]|uniref:helix-turn-helix domain-containing protein n=1 Tax=Micromonospora sp. NPDC006766 TaxID=3154778 RepID=UPI0033F4A182